MIRVLFLAHRYLGIALGLLVSLWCLSGIVMMYVQYPDLDDEERLGGLESLDLTNCCRLPVDFSNIPLDRFRVEMLAGRPVLRLLEERYQYVIDLASGDYLPAFYEDDARSIARSVVRELGLDGQPEFLGAIEQDQWTISGYDSHLPLLHFSAQDSAGTELYVSSTTGEVVQMTTFKERFWNWLGSVVHWIYPTIIRQHPYAWLQTIIWLSVISLFLTVIGVYIGIRQFKTRRSGRKSPYRGWGLWHHYAGLIFGFFTLTWLISGLFSVNPWGTFDGRSFVAESQRLRGGELDFETTGRFIASLPSDNLPGSIVRLEGSVLDGALYLVASTKQGQRTRINLDSLAPEPLAEAFFAGAGSRLRPDTAIQEAGWMSEGDAYYFSHHQVRHFPVYRIRYTDGERLYLDSVSGELAYAVDRPRQWSRWAFLALHRGDFSQLVRSRPIWDLLMLTLMLGVTVGAITGTWLGLQRLIRSARNPRKFPFNALPELNGESAPAGAVPSRSPGYPRLGD